MTGGIEEMSRDFSRDKQVINCFVNTGNPYRLCLFWTTENKEHHKEHHKEHLKDDNGKL